MQTDPAPPRTVPGGRGLPLREELGILACGAAGKQGGG